MNIPVNTGLRALDIILFEGIEYTLISLADELCSEKLYLDGNYEVTSRDDLERYIVLFFYNKSYNSEDSKVKDVMMYQGDKLTVKLGRYYRACFREYVIELSKEKQEIFCKIIDRF